MSKNTAPKVGDTISMNNGSLGVEQGILVKCDDSPSGMAIKWPDNQLEDFDYNSFSQFDGKIIKKAKT